jgi:hypothetical protein
MYCQLGCAHLSRAVNMPSEEVIEPITPNDLEYRAIGRYLISLMIFHEEYVIERQVIDYI